MRISVCTVSLFTVQRMSSQSPYRSIPCLGALVGVVRDLPEIEALYLFGSHAEGIANSLSDVDLGVLLSNQVSSEEYFDIRRRYNIMFADVLKADNVDVVVLNGAPVQLAFQIIAPRAIVFERDPDSRAHFEMGITRKFLDFRPFLETRKAYVRRQLLQGEFFG